MTTWPLAELKVSVLTKRDSSKTISFDLGEKTVTLQDGQTVFSSTGWKLLHLSQSPLVLTLSGEAQTKMTDKRLSTPSSRGVRKTGTTPPLASGFRLPKSYKTSYDKFLDLYDDVKKNGIRDISTIRINKDNVIEDGHHRLAVLFSLGKETITLPESQTVK